MDKKKPKTVAQLEAKLDRQLAKPKPSAVAVRRTREDLIKLKWAMGL